ncbi:SpoIID/LytB domain-containing protein [Nocardia blacklockiae]|uniref:SpoIID/LytB domain-containing protein n=1 Tax=Nocardia blacklockiae TaxID=480036 RepID=UPI001892E216|nr:SpoIID/LytB domain-containing protein [Nocardia blacklockiae]MBF6173486.1 SpoIID/LytB domain-containing protein [Nocardia blacklockiae]
MASARRGWVAVLRQGDQLRRRRRRHAVTAGLVVLSVTGGAVVVSATWSDGSPYRPVAGVGHGRGMSQVGAFDQATAGATAEGILAHYYPGAALGTIGPTTVSVRLTADDNETLDVFSDAGLTVADRRVVPGQAAHLTPMPDGGANVVITAGCDGDVIWQGATDTPWAYPVAEGTDRPPAEHLKVCGGGTYRGALGVALENGEARTVNEVDVDDYLLGVVPAEMQANWADQGGAEALRAQAIAARSYALAEHRYPYAQTCDTTDCQAYPGTEREDPRAAAAVRATAGRVLLRDGRILRTEYSAAPGGGQPIDIATLEVGPTPDELAPAPVAPPPADYGQQAVRGNSVIDAKYAESGGPAGPLGAAVGPESLLPGRIGTYRMFDHGVIIATPVLGARVVDFATLLQVAPEMATTPGADPASVPGTLPPHTAAVPTPRATTPPVAPTAQAPQSTSPAGESYPEPPAAPPAAAPAPPIDESTPPTDDSGATPDEFVPSGEEASAVVP